MSTAELPEESLAGNMLVQLKFILLHKHGSRIATRSVLVPGGGGHDIDVLRLERAGHQLAVVLASDLEQKGWAVPPTQTPEEGKSL